MTEPGLDRHEWEAGMRALEDQLGENPAETLPELDRLVAAAINGYRAAYERIVSQGEPT